MTSKTAIHTCTILTEIYIQATPDLPCSSSGSTAISFTIADYNGVIAPTWVSISLSSGQLTISTPKVSSNTDYSFYINSAVTGVSSSVQKVITITVFVCTVSNWARWSSVSSTIWISWNSGYTVNAGSWCVATTTKFTKHVQYTL